MCDVDSVLRMISSSSSYTGRWIWRNVWGQEEMELQSSGYEVLLRSAAIIVQYKFTDFFC